MATREESNSFLNAMGVLEELSSLRDMSVVNFVSYIENKTDPKASTKLFPWQSSLIEKILKLSPSTRVNLIALFEETSENHLEKLIECLSQIHQLGELPTENLLTLLNSLSAQRGKKQNV